MNEIILSFDKEQLEKYHEIMSSDAPLPELEAPPAAPEAHSREKETAFLTCLISELEGLLRFSKQRSSFFSTSLSKGEAADLIEAYCKAVMLIDNKRRELSLEILRISDLIKEYDVFIAETSLRYRDFLPYKAAFYEKKRCIEEIKARERQFTKTISISEKARALAVTELELLASVLNVHIPELLDLTGKAISSYEEPQIDERAFFAAVSTALLRLRAVFNEMERNNEKPELF